MLNQDQLQFLSSKQVFLKGKKENYIYQIPNLNKFYETMNDREFDDDDLDEFDEDIDDD